MAKLVGLLYKKSARRCGIECALHSARRVHWSENERELVLRQQRRPKWTLYLISVYPLEDVQEAVALTDKAGLDTAKQGQRGPSR